MTKDKYLKIISTGIQGSISSRCQDILGKVDRGQMVLGIVFFFEASGLDDYLGSESAIVEACREHFGKAAPVVTCVAQKPIGTTLTAEVLYLREDATVEYSEDYIIIRGEKGAELITKGIHFLHEGDTGAQARRIFGRIREILDNEGFKVNEIVRQWNYIEGITHTDGKIQNYQLFNDARSAFYGSVDWPNGYPAATGIGCSEGGVTVSVYAVKDCATVSKPIDNPIQVPAHKYSGKVLKEGREAVRTTPKFERARLLDDTVLVSGTAAIKGENSEISTDPLLQSEAAIDVMEHLVAPGNIFPDCPRFHFEAIRVYIKNEKDIPAIVSSLTAYWKGVPIHFLMADICRPELLLELEGIGTIGRFLECCCTDSGEAVEAQAGGAGRIELCEDLPCGGVTPSRDNITKVLSEVAVPVNVLIRARGGDFVYTEEEIEEMVESIRMCKSMGVNGVVIGALKPDGSVDMDAMRRMMEAAEGLSVTFHRAFDECNDPLKALEDIISLGCNRLLTAGHATNVNDGAPMLKELVDRAAGRIVIMAGSGVRPGNIGQLEISAGLREFHSSSHGTDGRTARETVSAMVKG
ncbi:MAG: hypothetical protein IKI00_08280 [Bacteroidales bacterium]|nr:hypothetical protein [Bacteroidales bacterium]